MSTPPENRESEDVAASGFFDDGFDESAWAWLLPEDCETFFFDEGLPAPFFDNEMEDFARVFFTDLLMGASPPTDWVSISLCANRFFMILSG
tara:strand:+ start:50975 stop:51250 length:276 start_codon:yes stop_codon:yes gene_type:complete